MSLLSDALLRLGHAGQSIRLEEVPGPHVTSRLDADPSGAGPDLILLDLNLPKVKGEEVLKRIRSSRKRNRSLK